jgi:hypothetical protein
MTPGTSDRRSRILSPSAARRVGGYYSENEFDITRLHHLRNRIVEIGRSCIDADYRSGAVIALLWSGLARYMQENGYDYLIGCASISMADGGHLAASLYHQLKDKHIAPVEYHMFPRCPLPLDHLRTDLPTEAEWVRAAELASGSGGAGRALAEMGWHAGNSGASAHPVASRRADALGLYDLFGNAAEWVTAADGRRVTRGGSWRDPEAQVGPHARAVQDDSWNERDPQFPKSRWWLSDGPFVGFRLVREP